jgi:zinc protease
MKRLFLSLATACMVATSINAQVPNVDATKLNTKLPIDSKIRTGTLPNGLKYYIRQNNQPEDFIEFRLAIDVGALQEDPDQNGVAHFTEHLLFNGTEKYPENKLLDFLEKTGARFGADINAYTSYDQTVYMIPIANEGDNLEKGVEILSEWADKALMDDKEIDAERGVIISEYRQRRSAMRRIQDELQQVAFEGTKYADHDVIGDTTLLMKAPYEAFKRFYSDWYIPQNQAVVIVGDIDVDKTESLIKKYFSDDKNPANPRIVEDYALKMNEGIRAGIVTDPEMPYTIANITMKKGPAESRGTIGDYRRTYTDILASSMMMMRAQEMIQSGNPPFRQMIARVDQRGFGISSFDLTVIPLNENILGGIDAAMKEVMRVYQNGFTESELTRAKAQVLSGYEQSYNSRDDRESGDLAMEYVRNFLSDEEIPGIEYEYALAQSFDKDITIEDVNSRIKSFINTEDNIVATIAAPESPQIQVPTEEELKNVIMEAANEAYAAYEDDTEGLEFFTEKLNPGKIAAQSTDEKSGVTTFELSNGVTVKVKPTDYKADEILFRASSPGGTSLVSDAEYNNARYAASLVNASGLGDFDGPTLSKLMAGKNANVSPYISDLYEGFYGQSSKKDLETMFQMLYMYFTKPVINKEAYDSWKTSTKSSLASRSNSPMSALQDTVGTVMNSYHFRSQPTTVEMIDQVDMMKAYNIYKQRFADADDFTYYIVGDISMDELKPMLEMYMANLPTQPTNEQWKDVGEKTPDGVVTKKIYKGLDDKAYVYLSITDDYDYSRKNNIDLDLLKTVVDFAMTKRLREEKGGVYSPSVNYSVSKEPNPEYSVNVFFSCDPNRVDELVTTVTDYYKELRAEGTEAADLEKFLKQEQTQHDLNMKNNNAWISWIMGADRNDISLNEYMSYKDDLSKLKLEDVKEIANKYVKDSELKTFIMYPTDYKN